MDLRAAAQRIEQLREKRGPRPLPDTLRRDIALQSRDLKKLQKRTGSIAEAWERIAPRELTDKATIDRLARGVLTLRVADAADRFELDRFLRQGGLDQLRAAAGAPIARVKIIAG